MFIDDVVDAFLMAATRPERVNGRHFVVGSGRGITIREAFELIASRVKQMTGRTVDVTVSESVTALSPIEQRNFVADPSRFAAATGWRAGVEPDRRHRSHHRGLHVRLVVTGALGHIGSRLIRDLARVWPGTEVVMLDNLATERYASLYDLPDACRYEFIEGDVLTEDLERVFAGADAVVHLAALTNWARRDLHPRMQHVNVDGTARVAHACASLGIGLLFPSTTSVYGVPHGVVSEDCSAAGSQAAESVRGMEVAIGRATESAIQISRIAIRDPSHGHDLRSVGGHAFSYRRESVLLAGGGRTADRGVDDRHQSVSTLPRPDGCGAGHDFHAETRANSTDTFTTCSRLTPQSLTSSRC